MKNNRFKWIKRKDGTLLGKVKTVMCKSQKSFDRQYQSCAKQNSKPVESKTVESKTVKPFLNTAMMAIYDREGEKHV